MVKTRPENIPKLKEYTPSRFILPTSHYDQAKADRAVKFIESLSHTKGKWAGKPFWLLPWQEQIIRDIFGIVGQSGKRQFRTAFVEIGKKNGKELALDTPIPTPDGFTSMGELRVGDIVFDERGRPCRVVAKSEVDDTEQAYKITFKDGTSIVAGARHLWDCEYIYGKRKAVEWSTEEIYSRTIQYRERFRDRPSAAREPLIRIPVCKPLQTCEADLPVDPYLYGYWLGNGCATEPWITVRDSDVEDIKSLIPYELYNTYPQPGSKKLVYRELKPILVDGFRSKVIRPEYLRASERQRWSLLQGLMDSDGCVSAMKGQSIYNTAIEALAVTVRELLWSLGIKNAVKAVPSTRNGWPTGEILYVIRFTTFSGQPTTGLIRKAVRQRIRTRDTRSNYHYLLDIQPVAHPVKMQCIQVDSPSHQYLAGPSMVPTHNSELAAAVVVDVFRYPRHGAADPLIQPQLAEHIFLRWILQRLPVGVPHTFNLNGVSQGGIRLVPVSLILPVILIIQTVDDRVKGWIGAFALHDFLCLCMQFITDAVAVCTGGSDQKEQRLFSRIAGAFRQHIVELPVRLGMDLIKDKPRNIQTVLGAYFS